MAKPFFRKDTETWYVRHKEEKIRVGKSQKAARHLADKINLDEAEGKVGLYKAIEKDLRSFFQEIIDYKENTKKLKKKSIIRYRGVIKNFLNFLDLRYPTLTNLSQLNQGIFESYIRYRKNTPLNKNGLPVKERQLRSTKDTNLRPGARDKTLKMEIQTLKSMLNYAVKSRDAKKRYLKENPLEYIEPIRVTDQREKRPLTEEEAQKFLSYLKEKDRELYEIFFTFIHTGMRDGELRHLQWSDVDFEKRVIILKEKEIINREGEVELWTPKTKNGKREIPIHHRLYTILKSRKKKHKDKSNFVFPDHRGGILRRKLRDQLIRAMRTIGIEDFTEVHGLRRTFISFMAMAGVPRGTTMDMVGHVDEETYELYRESTRKHRLESVNKLDFEA